MKIPLKVYLNPGHDRWLDPGACGNGLEEAEEEDVASEETAAE